MMFSYAPGSWFRSAPYRRVPASTGQFRSDSLGSSLSECRPVDIDPRSNRKLSSCLGLNHADQPDLLMIIVHEPLSGRARPAQGAGALPHPHTDESDVALLLNGWKRRSACGHAGQLASALKAVQRRFTRLRTRVETQT